MEKIYGILGCGISYTRSPELHAQLGGYPYQVFDIKKEGLDEFFNKKNFSGINVTVPYKTECIKYIDKLSPEAEAIGAVNTIVNENGVLTGYNTDYFGFIKQATSIKIDYKGKTALVLGNGGASKAVIKGLSDLGAGKILVCSRSGDINYNNVYKLAKDAEVIVNATPIGNSSVQSLIDVSKFPLLKGVLDLVYTPLRTKLVLDALARGVSALGGATMLVYQAVKASELFVGDVGQSKKAKLAYNSLVNSLGNVVLVGMAGSGKSSVGKALAEITGRQFVDTDLLIEEREGMTIPEIFSKFSERRFREIESDVISELYLKNGLVISTGGGAILSENNRDMLRANGKVVFIRRKISECDFKGRPLFENGGAEQVYFKRLPLYQKTADFEVDNVGTILECAKKIEENIL